MKTQKTFTNGFESWKETFYEVIRFIENDLIGYAQHRDYENIISETQEKEGHAGIYTLASDWTDQFEELNKNRAWDGEFMDEVVMFCKNKNQSN